MSRIIQYIENKKIIIVGMGREGKSTLSYIRKHLPEKHLTIADKNGFESDEELTFAVKELDFALLRLAQISKYCATRETVRLLRKLKS